MPDSKPHFLIVEARFYNELSNALLEGAKAALDNANVSYDVVTVPGALEVPAAIAYAIDGVTEYHGYIALGVIIRGATYHFEIVANQSSRALMDLSVAEGAPIGNGILTVENEAQAWERARISELDKGGFAARAAVSMLDLKNKMLGGA